MADFWGDSSDESVTGATAESSTPIDAASVFGSSQIHPCSTPPSRDDLIMALNLRLDPFRHVVTDQEVGLRFSEIYVDPEESLLSPLMERGSSFVFAQHGMGKSATRVALEYELRLTPGRAATLCVSYIPNSEIGAWTGPESHLERILQDLAIDVVIQAFERQHMTLEPLSDDVVDALERQASLLPARLRQRIQHYVDHPPADGVFWSSLRSVVEKITVSPRWIELLTIIARGCARLAPAQPSLHAALEDAHILGFTDVFILIDAVDDTSIDPERWLQFLSPLLKLLPQWQAQHVFLKCFLPLDLKKLLVAHYEHLFEVLTPSPSITTMEKMSASDLRRILQERIQAAKIDPASIVSFDLLAGADVRDGIEAWLAEQAQGLPRRVLSFASNLLDFHTTHGFQLQRRLYLTASEWQTFQQQILANRVTL